MFEDRYGLPLTTGSEEAARAYADGLDLLLSGWPGAADKFDAAQAADPRFALAHMARARVHATYAERSAALACVSQARAASADATARERGHVETLALAIEGQGGRAIDTAIAHLEAFPRDALVLGALLGAFGLYAFSGRADHDAARVAICDRLAPHYGEDWWFVGYRGWSHTENGNTILGRRLAENALGLRRQNAHAAHALTHAMFEQGDATGADVFIADWLPGYDPAGILYGHIAWHQALGAAEAGDAPRALAILAACLDPRLNQAAPLNAVTDLASLLWRLHIYGHEVSAALWNEATAYAEGVESKIGAPFAAIHFAMIEAGSGRLDALARRVARLDDAAANGRLPQGAVVPAACRAIGAFAQRDFARTIATLAPMQAEVVRLGGSHAQRELLEDTLIAACLRAGESQQAAAILEARLARRPSARDQRWRAQACART